MATIGGQLTQPEVGWRRYDDSYSLIKYQGEITSIITGEAYNGTIKYANSTNSTKVMFTFYGTRIRIISSASLVYSTNPNLITIDNITETYTQRIGSGYHVLSYEKVGLPLGLHNVVISPPNGVPFSFDAVDIDNTGELRNPYSRFLIYANDEILSAHTSSSNAIPEMTSNIAPIGVVSASSTFSTVQPYLAFDRKNENESQAWISNGVPAAWLSYKFSSPKSIVGYTIQGQASGTTSTTELNNRCPKDWTFEGSVDGTNWIVLDTRANISWTFGEKKIFYCNKIIKCNYYRISISANNGSIYTAIGEMEMIDKQSLISIKGNVLESDFLNYGSKYQMRTANALFTEVTQIKRNSDALGDGKIFTHTVNLNKHRIKSLKL